MLDLSVSDYIQTGTLALGLVVLGAGALNRWAVANHRDRLAMFTSAAANAGGRIREQLQALPPGSDRTAIKNILVSAAAKEMMSEFSGTAVKIEATHDKTAALINGQMGQTPAAMPSVSVEPNVVPGEVTAPAVLVTAVPVV